MALVDADARSAVGGAFAVDVAGALPVEADEEAFARCRTVAAGEALVVLVCVLVDVGGV
ncbi:MAG TPA: hypothetical protein VNV62_23560 [Trebonia sp.]|nr:hypothetical protein [Trebonia sp.]